LICAAADRHAAAMPEPDDLHADYPRAELRESEVAPEPFAQFERWLEDAVDAREPEPWAMALATSTRRGKPSLRMVYLRQFDERGFVFFTNYASRKGEELAANPHASLMSFWPLLRRSVRTEGPIARVGDADSDAYFKGRPRASQLSAWASPQSRVVESRRDLERRVKEIEARFPDEVPRPPFWGGFRLSPSSFEFWQGRESRLHDRLRYRLLDGGGWAIERLAP
jgi:pyridoxamine 5'-phosphate oxidase